LCSHKHHYNKKITGVLKQYIFKTTFTFTVYIYKVRYTPTFSSLNHIYLIPCGQNTPNLKDIHGKWYLPGPKWLWTTRTPLYIPSEVMYRSTSMWFDNKPRCCDKM